MNINVKIKSYNELLKTDKANFILALQLTRLSNSIRSQLRLWRKVIVESENENNMIKIKNRFDITLLLASALYESIKTYKKDIENKMQYCQVSKENESKYLFYKERYDKKEFEKNTFLRLVKTLRDKIIFHFDKDIITNTINQIHFDEEEHLIAFGASRQTKDVFFSIPDDIVLTYLMEEFSSLCPSKKVADFYEIIESQIVDESLKLAEYFDHSITSLLNKHIYWTYEESNNK